MKTAVLHCDFGQITYRVPNALDVPDIMASMNLGVMNELKGKDVKATLQAKSKDEQVRFALRQKSSLMRNMEPYILKIDVEVNGEKIDNWDDMIEQPAMGMPLMQIAEELMIAMAGIGSKKKKPSKQPASSGRAKSQKTKSKPQSAQNTGPTSKG